MLRRRPFFLLKKLTFNSNGIRILKKIEFLCTGLLNVIVYIPFAKTTHGTKPIGIDES